MFVPEIVFEARPDDFGNAGLLSEDKAVAVMSSFESGEAERLGDRAHHENIGNRVDVAEFFTTNKTSKNDVFADAEIGG